MDYESFKEKFVEDVKDRLYEQGAEVDLSIHTVNKLNESYEAITVTPEGNNIGVNIGIDKFYGAIEDGRPYDEVVDKAVDVINNGINQRPDFDIESLSDYSQMKEKLAMEVVSAEANKEMLETVPHQNMEDMAVVYRFVLSYDDDGRASILVTNQLLENMGVTPEQLHADAMENAPQIKPVEIKGMSEVMAEMMGVEQAEMMGLFPVAPEDEKIYVATVPDKVHGAGVLAYQNFMDQAAERAGGDFFILPSSIHEVLIVPDNGEMGLKELEAMVKEVNAIQGWLNMQSNAGELWDVYDENRNFTGKLHRRGDFLENGEYHLVVHVWLQNSNGEFLLTKRTPNKGYPNMWESTGGSALAGDDSLSAALREVREETGLIADPNHGECVISFRREDCFVDVWLFKQDFNLDDVVLQDGETCDKMYANVKKIRELNDSGMFVPYSYLQQLLDMVR